MTFCTPSTPLRDLFLLEAQRLAGFVDHRGHAGVEHRAAQAAARAAAVQDDPDAEAASDRQRPRILEVGADLRKVGAARGSGVQVDQRVAVADHALVERVRDAGSEAAVRAAREGAIQIPPIGQIARCRCESPGCSRREPRSACPRARSRASPRRSGARSPLRSARRRGCPRSGRASGPAGLRASRPRARRASGSCRRSSSPRRRRCAPSHRARRWFPRPRSAARLLPAPRWRRSPRPDTDRERRDRDAGVEEITGSKRQVSSPHAAPRLRIEHGRIALRTTRSRAELWFHPELLSRPAPALRPASTTNTRT